MTQVLFRSAMILKLFEENMEQILARAVSVLLDGGIVAYPTETFYALGAKYDVRPALKKLYEIKQRPQEKAVPLIVCSEGQLGLLTGEISDTARGLSERFWPGPLTMVFSALEGLDEYLVSEGKVAVRIPGGAFALRLAAAAGFPITSTSANISDMPPAEDAGRVMEYFGGKIDLVIDSGRTPGGLPSTIVDVSGNTVKVLRKGAVSI